MILQKCFKILNDQLPRQFDYEIYTVQTEGSEPSEALNEQQGDCIDDQMEDSEIKLLSYYKALVMNTLPLWNKNLEQCIILDTIKCAGAM